MNLETNHLGEGLRTFFRGCATGLWVITTVDPDGRPVGFTASSVASVSLDPAVFTISMQAGSSSWPAVEATGRLIVHALSAGQQAVARLFSTSGVDRFRGVNWRPAADGLPLIEGSNGWMSAEILTIVPVGESRLLLCRATETHIPGNRRPPLVHHDRAYWATMPA